MKVKNVERFLLVGLMFLSLSVLGQTGVIRGVVVDRANKETVPFANLLLENTSYGTATDFDGAFTLEGIEPGVYNLIVSVVGYERYVLPEITVGVSKPVTLEIFIEQSVEKLEGVTIKASPFTESPESPVSLRTINTTEILRNPGGNRDISKVIQTLPGVATTVSFRNDIIIRGGAPNENRFYLDDIEVPNINHFATQGSSGGPVGLINVNFIREVDFYASAFPSNRMNTLSSVMNFKQVSGNPDRLAGTFMIGSSDIGLTLDGPTGDKSSFILSARRSYLQFLFSALKLPFLPTYNDFQYKHVIRPNDKNKFTIIGLGAIDDFELNQSVNDGIDDPDELERNNYILNTLPVNTQWNYTIGGKWEHFSGDNSHMVVLSRSRLDNKSVKYRDNIEIPSNLLLNYASTEGENNIRYEFLHQGPVWTWSWGVNYQFAQYTNSTLTQREFDGNIINVDFSSKLNLNKYGGFIQANRKLFSERLSLSMGLRTDANDFSSEMSNPLDQLSPRLSLSYALAPKLSLSFNIGRYFQLPPYTVLGFRSNQGELVNRETGIKYISADHYVLGLESQPTPFSKITLEGFYKNYRNYPFILSDSISLANLGGDFGVIGNEPASPYSNGRSYGVEFLAQQKMSKTIYGIVALTLVRSEFTDKNREYVPSSWDNRFIANLTAGKQFKRNWEIGIKFRYQGGSPYTPYDLERSATKEIWDVTQQGVFDYNQLNSQRYKGVHGLDVRVDKKWYFNRWSINLYLDIQNIYNYQIELQPFLTVQRDGNGAPITDPNDPSKYLLKPIENVTGTVLPSIGLMVEF